MDSGDRDIIPTASPPAAAARRRVSLVIPVFNSEATLQLVHRQLVDWAWSPVHDFEIIFVDDASTDGSLAVLREIERHAANVVVVEHPRNRGRSWAVVTGILAAQCQIVVTLDDDLQHHPGEIPHLLAALESADTATLVIGVADAIKRPLWRGWLAIGANAVSNLFLARRLPLQLTTFCAFRRQLCAHLDPDPDQDLPLMTVLVQAARIVRTVPVHVYPSLRSSSRYRLGSLLKLFLSRSGYYRRSRVLGWLAAVSLAMIASLALLLTQGLGRHPLLCALLPSVIACWLMLVLLAIKVQRRTSEPDFQRANRPA